MTLLRDIVAVLDGERIPHALIGAMALAVHGVSRATADVDLLTVDRNVLREELWREIAERGATVRVLEGDAEDPLAGTVRLSLPADRIVDIVVGRHAWQREIIEAAETLMIEGVPLKVVRPAGLVLLKLHAGGPKDAWDIRSLLESHAQPDAILAEVDGMVTKLPAACARSWERLRGDR